MTADFSVTRPVESSSVCSVDFFKRNRLKVFQEALLQWYSVAGRKLPWRNHPTPYRVWVSEIMLQQTTTITVQGYFDRFMAAFPDVQTLAHADVSEVLKLWEGLGYYRRARQLHEAANKVVREWNGHFPTTANAILSLPGIGRYTAGAIASIACGEKAPIVEANTIRLYSRLADWPQQVTTSESIKFLWDFAQRILPDKNCGLFNQALMDIGSQICRPDTPLCEKCPIAKFCMARANHHENIIPVMPPRQEKEQREEVAIAVSLADWTGQLKDRHRFLFLQSPNHFRWAGLWDFPRFLKNNSEEITNDHDLNHQVATCLNIHKCLIHPPVKKLTHTVTRFRIRLDFCPCSITPDSITHKSRAGDPLQYNPERIVTLAAGTTSFSGLEYQWLTPQEASKLPMNTTAKKLLKELLTQGERTK